MKCSNLKWCIQVIIRMNSIFNLFLYKLIHLIYINIGYIYSIDPATKILTSKDIKQS